MFFFFSSRRRHTRLQGDWSSDVCSSDLLRADTSIEKSLMSMGSKLASDAAKTKDVEILKGPKR